MIIWRRQALEDLADVITYVAERNPEAAERLYSTVRTVVERLSKHPGLGRAGRVPRTRELVVAGTSFIVPYIARGGRDVIILRVLSGRQQWPETFEE